MQVDKVHTVLELKDANPSLNAKMISKLTGYRLEDVQLILDNDEYESDDDLEVFSMYNRPVIEDLNEQF